MPFSAIQKARRQRRQSGFTLIELLVTLTIAAILLTVAVPNFLLFLQNSRLTSQANDFITMLNYAKSEAIKRGVRTTVCSSVDGVSCAASTTWETGWLVFVDCDGNGSVDNATCPDWDGNGVADDEPVLQVRQRIEGGNTLRAAVAQRVTYQNSGFSGFADTFRLCDTRGNVFSRAITLNRQGRVSVATGTGICP